MKVDELAEELAEFWFSAISRAGWDERLRILNEIHAQLRSDIPQRTEYEALSPRFVANLINRLGAPPVECDAQAEVYASSFAEPHRQAASEWRRRQSVGGLMDRDRRRFPRRSVGAISEIWVQGRSTHCQLIDLSQGGARIMAEELPAAPGTPVRLAVPDQGVRDAMVVFRSTAGIGLRFADQPAAA